MTSQQSSGKSLSLSSLSHLLPSLPLSLPLLPFSLSLSLAYILPLSPIHPLSPISLSSLSLSYLLPSLPLSLLSFVFLSLSSIFSQQMLFFTSYYNCADISFWYSMVFVFTILWYVFSCNYFHCSLFKYKQCEVSVSCLHVITGWS